MEGNYKIEYKKVNKGNLELGLHKRTWNDLDKKVLNHTTEVGLWLKQYISMITIR